MDEIRRRVLVDRAIAEVGSAWEYFGRIADTLVERRELYGDELIAMLNAQRFKKPEIDWTKDETWPQM